MKTAAQLLTKRESQIAEMIAWGAAKKEIADQLFISERTVENTARAIYDKTGVSKANELSAWWFCTRFNISFTLSPLKRQFIAIVFLGIIAVIEFQSPANLFARRTRTETRNSRSRKNEGDCADCPEFLNYLIEL